MIDSVRRQAAWVAEQADFIKIRHDLIPKYTQYLLDQYPLIDTLDTDMHFVDPADARRTVAYAFALDSINFGSGYFETAKMAGVKLEYDLIAGGLKRAFEAGEMDQPEKWVAATAEQLHSIMAVPSGVHLLLDQLMKLFADHLRFTGRFVQKEGGGDVMNVLQAAEGSAVKLAGQVASWVGFEDKNTYKGQEVPFYKRAQILASDVFLALEKKPPANFSDMQGLTIFADNMVPHVLRYDGILEYTSELSTRIDTGSFIDAGSAEETEIRACAIHAVEQMVAAADADVTAVNLDHLLWHRGYIPEIYALPKHRTVTIWY